MTEFLTWKVYETLEKIAMLQNSLDPELASSADLHALVAIVRVPALILMHRELC